MSPEVDPRDVDAVRRQLGREPRGVRAVAHRCSCGDPDVVETEPRLPIGTLEAAGVMRAMQDRLAADADLAATYRRAHDDYLARRDAIAHVAEIDGIAAGGMPTRVKCLHVLVGHALAAGPGVNPFGDEALAMLPDWGASGPCTRPDEMS